MSRSIRVLLGAAAVAIAAALFVPAVAGEPAPSVVLAGPEHCC